MDEVTRVIRAIEKGDAAASDRLLPLVYRELRQLAARKLACEAPGQTLQATALVHEAYLRLIGADREGETRGRAVRWDSRAHFFAAAAEAMRRILIDNARRKQAVRHGGGRNRVELGAAMPSVATNHTTSDSDELLALDGALQRLAAEDPVKSELVRLRYFAGLSIEEAAAVLGLSRATAYRHWLYARAWLHDAISSAHGETTGSSIPHEPVARGG